jgi:hypothetical protein
VAFPTNNLRFRQMLLQMASSAAEQYECDAAVIEEGRYFGV